MKPAIKLAMVAVLAFLVSSRAQGQCINSADVCVKSVPHFVKFSGMVRNFASFPANRVVAVRFVVYASSTGGTPLWQEVQNIQIDQEGHYEVALGATSDDGIPVDLFTSGGPRWLSVQALLPGQEEQARVMLVSVPYALEAENAQTLGGLPPSAYAKAGAASTAVNSSGSNIAIPSALALTATNLSTVGNPRSTPQDITVSGATVNTIPKFSSTSSLTNSQITDQNGIVSMQNLDNILFADAFPGGVPAAVVACPANGCVIYAVSPNVNLNLGTIDPGSKVITIYLGPFNYTVKQITLRSGLKIIGMGGGQTLLNSNNGNNPVFVLPQTQNSPAINVLLSGFHLAGSPGNTNEDCFFLDTSSAPGSGLWYSTFNDIYMQDFAGIALHIKGPNSNFFGLTQWVLFNNVVAFRVRGGANALRLEGGVFELRFVNCQFDGQGVGDGTNIYIGGLAGGVSGYPWSIVFEGLVSQQADTAVQIDGGQTITFRDSHHESLNGVYQVNNTHRIPTWGLVITDSSFAGNIGKKGGNGFILNVTTTIAQVNFTHNLILGAPDSIVKSTNLATVNYEDNYSGQTVVPVTSGITTQMVSASDINIQGVHLVAMVSSTTPIATIQSSLGPGETVTIFAVSGPFTLAAGGNIGLMGARSVTVNGSITLVRSDVTQGLHWIPISQWSPMR